ncbi:MAG: methionine adenosyltransferase [Planctomycetota bacterium]|nr:methionine adenosyltransferase [Planctomycetota bacterium]
MHQNQLFTSESVSVGHPDKLADQVSDSILDEMLRIDPNARVACETMVTTGLCVVGGEVTCDGYVEIRDVVRKTITDVGYDSSDKGMDGESCAVMIALDEQSPEISMGVTEGEGAHSEQGAGDQGLMFGFASDETEGFEDLEGMFMPLPAALAQLLTSKMSTSMKEGALPWARPDSKSQVTVEYENMLPKAVHTVVLSTQHGPEWTRDQGGMRDEVIEHIIKPVLGDWYSNDLVVHTNPTGSFERGGPHGDCGLTGRKIIVDTYGGMGRHGGGAFSGKDPSKVDRSAAYMARYIAKNLVAAGLCDRCEVQLSYAIGVAEPTSVSVDTFGTEKVDPGCLEGLIRDHFELTPKGIIDSLGLKKPIYLVSAALGHFGRVPGEDAPGSFSWEQTDVAEALSRAAASTSQSG